MELHLHGCGLNWDSLSIPFGTVISQVAWDVNHNFNLVGTSRISIWQMGYRT